MVLSDVSEKIPSDTTRDRSRNLPTGSAAKFQLLFAPNIKCVVKRQVGPVPRYYIKEREVANFTPRPFYPQEITPVPTE